MTYTHVWKNLTVYYVRYNGQVIITQVRDFLMRRVSLSRKTKEQISADIEAVMRGLE